MIHKRKWSLLLCFLSGCSTHPLADACDYFKPGKLGPTTVQPYGGVTIPQGPILPPAPDLPGTGVPIPPATGVGVIPAPMPLPGSRPPGFQLQPPTGEFPPLPPDPPRPR